MDNFRTEVEYNEETTIDTDIIAEIFDEIYSCLKDIEESLNQEDIKGALEQIEMLKEKTY